MVVALALYSVALLVCELLTSQDFVRNFVADIAGPVPLYAVNTTLSASLLWATALLFAVCAAALRPGEEPRLRRFYVSQVIMFLFLGVDDRFHTHEIVAEQLAIPDHYVLAVVAVIEVLLLVRLGGSAVWRHPSRPFLVAGAVAFCVMLAIDALVPHDLVLRLTTEDLAKTWGGFFLFLWAWSHVSDRLERLKSPQTGRTSE